MVSSCSTGGWEVQDQGNSRFEFGESMFPGLQVDSFLLYPHLLERETEKENSLKALLTRALIPFNLQSDYCLNTPPPNTIPLKIRFQHVSCEEMFFLFVCFNSSYLLAIACSMWGLSCLTREWTQTPCSGGVESKPLDCQGSPQETNF